MFNLDDSSVSSDDRGFLMFLQMIDEEGTGLMHSSHEDFPIIIYTDDY